MGNDVRAKYNRIEKSPKKKESDGNEIEEKGSMEPNGKAFISCYWNEKGGQKESLLERRKHCQESQFRVNKKPPWLNTIKQTSVSWLSSLTWLRFMGTIIHSSFASLPTPNSQRTCVGGRGACCWWMMDGHETLFSSLSHLLIKMPCERIWPSARLDTWSQTIVNTQSIKPTEHTPAPNPATISLDNQYANKELLLSNIFFISFHFISFFLFHWKRPCKTSNLGPVAVCVWMFFFLPLLLFPPVI